MGPARIHHHGGQGLDRTRAVGHDEDARPPLSDAPSQLVRIPELVLVQPQDPVRFQARGRGIRKLPEGEPQLLRMVKIGTHSLALPALEVNGGIFREPKHPDRPPVDAPAGVPQREVLGDLAAGGSGAGDHLDPRQGPHR